jgi:hypothetical protein
MVTPEYNHSPSPALLNTLNHFGSSLFSFKPSAIVSYSQGQWGGARAAAGLRPFLSELGCLPVSAMVHVPHAHQRFDEAGMPTVGQEDADKWEEYGARTWAQLEWWGAAAAGFRADCVPMLHVAKVAGSVIHTHSLDELSSARRLQCDPFAASPAFTRNPVSIPAVVRQAAPGDRQKDGENDRHCTCSQTGRGET